MNAVSRTLVIAFLAALPVFMGVGLCGCGRQSSTGSAANRTRAERVYRDDLFASAVSSLNSLEEFDAGGSFAEVLRRMDIAQNPGKALHQTQNDPLWATWPQPPVLRQIVDRLNLWMQGASAKDANWNADPMLAELPSPLRELPELQRLDALGFDDYDGFALVEAIWMRDVAGWAHGDRLDDLSRAQALFDWTMRNIGDDLTPDGLPSEVPQVPWETLLYGRGSVWERAWVFISMARQLGIEAAVLAITDESGTPKPWAVGVLSGDKVYVFDPLVRLPLTKRDGLAWRDGRLSIEPATLAELAADEAALRQHDIEGPDGRAYPVRAEQLERVTVWLDASPFALSLRARLIESRLTGTDRVVLSASPSMRAARWRKIGQVAEVGLWEVPWRTLQSRRTFTAEQVIQRLLALSYFYGDGSSVPLRRGRLLHLKGKLVGKDSASAWYQQSRPANEDMREELRKIVAQEEKRIAQMPEDRRAAEIAQIEALINLQVQLAQRTKLDATYWLALVAYEREKYASAKHYLEERVLPVDADRTWTAAARYNLGRVLERLGNVPAAIEVYRSDAPGLARPAMLLRAQWLQRAASRGDE